MVLRIFICKLSTFCFTAHYVVVRKKQLSFVLAAKSSKSIAKLFEEI